MTLTPTFRQLVGACATSLLLLGPSLTAQAEVDFNREVRPLLSDRCFKCHGPDEKHREGGFRLDQKESAFGTGDSGLPLIVPGKPEESELYVRISSSDPDVKMPPPDSGKTLTPEEIQTIRQWIAEGAKWEQHWAFVTPRRPRVPHVENSAWVRNPIDAFILARLEKEGLRPSPPADRVTLIRRVSLDLTGLPPTPEEVDAFVNDPRPDAYERLVDRLLNSPHYGEHMAHYWLDAARYGDTHGLHLDNYREMWAYRDWVIQAFNQNKPYDEFTIEQLAGDLLPNPTDDQLIATGFLRCHVTTNEGGSIVEEVYVRNVVDRVVTTATVFLGMTFDCSRCHDHKYDPFTMRDFYSTFAYFNSLDGSPMDGNRKDPPPVLKVLAPDQKATIAALRQRIDQTRKDIRTLLAGIRYVEPENPRPPKLAEPVDFVWIDDALPAGARPSGPWKFVSDPVHSGKKAHTQTAQQLDQHYFTGARKPLRIAEGDTLFAYVYLDPKNPPRQIMLQFNDGSWEHRAYWGENLIPWGQDGTPSRRRLGDLPEAGRWVRLDVPAQAVGLKPGSVLNGWAFTQFGGTVYWDTAGIRSQRDQNPTYDSFAQWLRDQQAANGAGLPEALRTLVAKDPAQRSEADNRRLLEYFLEYAYSGTRKQFAELHRRIEDAEKRIAAIEAQAATTLIFRERKDPKPAYILRRGEYDQRLEQVPRAVPAVLPPLPEGVPNNRLGWAKWLVSPEHPLTARVAVNRFWQQVFGIGIVKTAEDFGSQGEPPSHPRLLDWLAVEFRESGWNVKELMRLIVTSATYRQSSVVRPELLKRDPENRLLARGPRFRLDAEVLRDQALFVSGLLYDKLGGPSVKPPQPDGLWFAVGYSGSNTVRFKKDVGPDKVYRRTVYTFIKRTAPPPQLSTFDAPSREACMVRRERTNTPLQALLLLNDPQYFEAARAFAERVIREAGPDPERRIERMFRLALGRRPDVETLRDLLDLQQDLQAAYAANPGAARSTIAVGETPPDPNIPPVELASWTLVANTVLNMDELLNKN
ncbi:MAG: DUF1553 domain-containing protein [Planctomycetota bacterium]|nr:MAG: DUF1553 domain-containing protein [Planctomycetota bacterium]